MCYKKNIFNIINTNHAPEPIGPYVQAININNFVFISGQIPMCPKTKKVPNSIYDQTRQSLKNIRNIIKTANLEVINIIKTTLFIININDLPEINTSYKNFFDTYSIITNKKNYYPTRSCVEIAKLPKNAKIEIEAIAMYF